MKQFGNIFSMCTRYIAKNTISIMIEIVSIEICIITCNSVCTIIINNIYKNKKECGQ